MKLLKKLFNFYVFSNLHVAIAGFSLTRITEINYGIENCNVSIFVALGIVVSYNFIRYFEIKSDRLAWFYAWFQLNSLKLIVLSAFSFFGLFFLMFTERINIDAIIFMIPFCFMTFFYVVPLFKIGKMEVSFRNLPFIKIFSISIAWAGITAFLPIVNAGIVIKSMDYLMLISQFLFVFAITIPFDIRDVIKDDSKLKTIPQVFGVEKAKAIGVLVVLFLILVSYFKCEKLSIDLLVVGLVTIIFLFCSSIKRNRFYASFWVESIPILWLLLTLVL